MKKLLLLLLFGILLGSTKIYAQCNETLVQLAVAEIGDATYLKNFNVKLKNQQPGDAQPPVASYKIVLNKGNHYRFNVKNAKEFPGEAIMQLYDANALVGTNFSPKTNRTYKAFDFVCQKTAEYQILFAFKDGKEGCAVGLLSLVK